MTDIAGSTVLITGAASGLGRLLAVQCADAGARVVAWDIDGSGLSELAAARPGVIEPYVVDVTDRAAVASCSQAAIDAAGGIDVLILNAGVVSGGRLLDLPPDAIERVMNVNVLALFWCAQAVLPHMVERDAGHVVTIASIAALTPMPGLSDYVASKHGAYGFAESLRMELALDAPGVRTTVVLPQVLDTGMFAGVTTLPIFPPLDPGRAASEIIDGVARNRQRILLNRPTALAAYLLRPLPPRITDSVHRLLGGGAFMSTFRGRSVRTDLRDALVDE